MAVVFAVDSAVSYFGDRCTPRDRTVIAQLPTYRGADIDWRRPLPPWGPRYCNAYLRTADSPAEVFGFYRRELRKRGWIVVGGRPDEILGDGTYTWLFAQRIHGETAWTLSISDFEDGNFYLSVPDDPPHPNFVGGDLELIEGE